MKKTKHDKWESQTFKIIEKFLDKKYSCIDIGAWIGPTVLYECQLSRHCYAIEPDPIAFHELQNNVKLNKNLYSQITLCNFAISNSNGIIKFYNKTNEFGNSESSIVERNETNYHVDIKSKTFDQFIQEQSITHCNFIKMDIEGGEFTVLPTMFNYLKMHKPTLLIEFHPHLVDNPIQKLEELRNVLNIYDHLCDEELKEIDIDTIFNSFKNKPTKTLQLVLTS